MQRTMTRRSEGRHILNACRRSQVRAERWRRELEARGPLSAEDAQLLDDWMRWNIHRLTDAYMLLCPAPFVRRLKQADDGTWSRTPAYEAAIAVAAATHAAGFRRNRHKE
jgi:hypothetical protein